MSEILPPPEGVDVDELAAEDRLDEDDQEPQVGVDANGRAESSVLTALRELGPSTARELARRLDRDTGNVSTRLRQLEREGRVHRTGRSVTEPGQRGGPSVEWELMPVNGTATEPGVLVDPPGPVEQRLRAMAERVGRANGRIEQLENEIQGAKARADQADQRARDAERRRQDAERQLAGAATTGDDVRPRLVEARRRVTELEEQVAALQVQLQDASSADVGHELAHGLAETHAATVQPDCDVAGMRRSYFDVLLSMAQSPDAPEHVFDRLERLIDGPGVD